MLQPASLTVNAHAAVGTIAHGSDAITVPDAHLLFSGDFKRTGSDLILSDHDHEFVVHDYFRGDSRPVLLSPEGAQLAADVVEALTGHGAYAQAGATPNTAAAVGRVAKVDGNATIIRNGVAITVNPGDAVFKGDVLQTGAGVLGVTFLDGSTLNLSANSRLLVSDFVYEANGSANSELLNLVQGSLSFVSGEVAHSHGDMRITTPVATMGIRGTVGGVTEADDGSVKFFVVESASGAVLLDGAGRVIGQVVQDGPTIHVLPNGLMQELAKTPQELALELSILQQVLNTQTIGRQILEQFFQHDNPHSTGTDHTQIEIDIPTAAMLGTGTGIDHTVDSLSSNTATVTTTTTDQNGDPTTTREQVNFQQPQQTSTGNTTVHWTGGAGPGNTDSSNTANWDTNQTPGTTSDVIIGADQNGVPSTVSAPDGLTVNSLTLTDGAQLLVDSVSAAGNIVILGNNSTPTGIIGDLEIAAGNDLWIEADGAGASGNEPAVAEIVACGAELTIAAIGGSFLLSAVADGGYAVAKIEADSVSVGDVGQGFSVLGSADHYSADFAAIVATCGDLSIGNIGSGNGGGGFDNQGLLAADHGTLSIGAVTGSFVNEGVMRADELHTASGGSALDNEGAIIVSGCDAGMSCVDSDVHNSGFIKVADGAQLQFDGDVHNSDCGIILASGGGINFAADVWNDALIKASGGDIDFHGSVHNTGTIESANCGSISFETSHVDNCGIIEARSDGTINFDHWVGGSGTLAVDGGTIELASGTCNTIDFSGHCGGTLVLDCAAAPVGQITGFGSDDSIDLVHLNDVSIVGYTQESSTSGLLELHSCSVGDFSLSFTGDCTDYTINNFALSCDQNGGTLITEGPAIDVLNQCVVTDGNNVTTVKDFAVVDPFVGNEPLTITAQAGDGTLSFVDSELNSGQPTDTITETATLSQINCALAQGIIYTPNPSPPCYDTVAMSITDCQGNGENLTLMFKVAGQGGADFTATCGNDVMYGTQSCDSFTFNANQNGNDVVANFDSSHDVLDFDNSVFNCLTEVLDSAHDDLSGNAVITTAHNGTITLDHVSVAQLNSSNVVFHGTG